MKRIKAIAIVLAVSMLAGLFAGCGKTTKTTTDKFVKACSKMKLEELDAEEPEIELSNYEDGFYVTADEGSVDELSEVTDLYLSTFGLTGIVDTEDVESFALAVKLNGYEDLKDAKDISELEDLTLDGAFAMQMTLSSESVKDVTDNLKDMFDLYGIKTKNLSSKEYYTSKNEGYFRFHVNLSEITSVLTDSDDLMSLACKMMDEDDAEDLAAALTGDIAVSVEVNGNNIFIIAGASLNAKSPSVFGTFAKSFGIAKNPMKLPTNEKLAASLADTAFKDFIAAFSKTTIISIEDFEYACENDLEFDEYDFFDLKDMDPLDVENGIYLVADAATTDLIRRGDSDSIETMLIEFGIDDIIDSYDVESFGFAVICKGLEDIRYSSDPNEFAEAEVDGAFAFVMNFTDGVYADEVIDYLEDMLDDIDVDVDDLTPEEYYRSKDESYLRFHIDINKLMEMMLKDEDFANLISAIFGGGNALDYLKSLTGDFAVSIEVNESNMFILAGLSLNTEPTYINEFSEVFDAAENPIDIPMNEEATEDFIDFLIDKFM
ncbi:MAG: hypothetical protein IKF31_03150 [Clostridiales bacterium]|nr:hypothetical protein [Clostridiales bacterium]